MKKSKFLYSLPFKLLVSVALGMGFGLLLNFNSESAFTTAALNVIVTLKYILGQLINFCVPLIIIGFIAPSITMLPACWGLLSLSPIFLPWGQLYSLQLQATC